MKKNIKIFFLILILTAISFVSVSAQSLSKEDIASVFSKAILREQFVNKTNMQYYRFVKNIWYFDPLGLSYFPSENLTDYYWKNPNNFGNNEDWGYFGIGENDWALLGRELTSKVEKQFIYLKEPAEYDVFHGQDFPRVTYLDNFYLYTDLFVIDEYPEQKGSGYVYFSNSMLTGNRDNYGILIDPRDGIYKASNNYDSYNATGSTNRHYGYYVLGREQHGLDLIYKLDPSMYEGKTDCLGDEIYPIENLSTRFNDDLEAVKQAAEKDGLTGNISVYRIEIVRLEGKTAVYINGVFVYEFEDGIITDGLTYISNRNNSSQYASIRGKRIDLLGITEKVYIDDVVIDRLDDDTWSVYDPTTITRLVSWSVGPRLYAGGETVTMASGNLILYGTN